MNTFINFIKRSLIRGGIKSKVGALKEVKALLLPALNFFARS